MVKQPLSKLKVLFLPTIISVGTLFAQSSIAAQVGPDTELIPGQYIVKLVQGQRALDVVPDIAKQHGLGIGHTYGHALNGFSARIPAARLEKLKRDYRIVSVIPDRKISLNARGGKKNKGGDTSNPQPPQIIPTGISRINGNLSSTVSGDGNGSVDADVAVIDTGISSHADLNIVGGKNCLGGSPKNYRDGNGHGTHVAGTIGARDNGTGVVGVAPDVRLWAVKVLDSNGSGSWSSIICGIDYVASRASTIEIANMSLGGNGSIGNCSDGGMREAICNASRAGVTFIAAAGNESSDTVNKVPAVFPEVITVSALADFDGQPGSAGQPSCRSDSDDTFANFSNFGRKVDLIAPGVCITSTWNDGSLSTISGTSMAAPHVAGAAALYKSKYPYATPDEVKLALQSAGQYDWIATDDPDGIQEPLLDISQF